MAAAAAALIAAQPATAQVPTWSVVDTESRIAQTANAQITDDSDPAKWTVALACTASSRELAGVGVTQCFLQGADTRRWGTGEFDASPGPVDASAREGIVIPRQAYKVCVRAQAFFIADSTFFTTSLRCSPLS